MAEHARRSATKRAPRPEHPVVPNGAKPKQETPGASEGGSVSVKAEAEALVKLTIRLPKSRIQALKIAAVTQERTAQDIVDDALRTAGIGE